MSKKFTLPKRFKVELNKEIIDWYESKLDIMENRQASLSNKLREAYSKIKGLKNVHAEISNNKSTN
jgi:hypothetical protein